MNLRDLEIRIGEPNLLKVMIVWCMIAGLVFLMNECSMYLQRHVPINGMSFPPSDLCYGCNVQHEAGGRP